MPPVNAGEHSQQSPEQSPELLAREQERQRFREERARMAPPPQSRRHMPRSRMGPVSYTHLEEAVRPCVRRIRSSVGQLQHRDNLAPVCRRQLLRRRPDGGRSVKVVYQQVGLAPPDGNHQFPPCRRRKKEHRIQMCIRDSAFAGCS